MPGPISGVKVLELAGIGPGPHAAMLLSDLGAEVVLVERAGVPALATDQTLRGRRKVQLDLKSSEGRQEYLAMARLADVVIDGYRPGVAERLGVGPDDLLSINPKLVYARMTGWGLDGPFAARAGHDINYISLTGALAAVGRAGEPPMPPLNLVGDFGGGSMFLVVGVLSALLERTTSGQGQVVDAAMVDGTSSLLQLIWSLRYQGNWSDSREDNIIDGAAPYYGTYECADGKYVAVGAIEPQFYQLMLQGLGVKEDPKHQNERSEWPRLRQVFADAFRSRTRDEWAEIFFNIDACVTPVLSFSEAAGHPHIAARSTLIERDGAVQAAPAPRFSRSVTETPERPPTDFTDCQDVVLRWS